LKARLILISLCLLLYYVVRFASYAFSSSSMSVLAFRRRKEGKSKEKTTLRANWPRDLVQYALTVSSSTHRCSLLSASRSESGRGSKGGKKLLFHRLYALTSLILLLKLFRLPHHHTRIIPDVQSYSPRPLPRSFRPPPPPADEGRLLNDKRADGLEWYLRIFSESLLGTYGLFIPPTSSGS